MDFTIFGCALQFFDGSRGRGVCMRALTVMALMAVTTMMLPAATRAQQSDDRSRCFAREGASPEDKLQSCTAVIQSGGQTPQGLVAAFNSRGNVHLNNRNYDRAIDDYNETIRIDPKYAIGFYNRGLAYLRKGRLDPAIADFRQALTLQLDDPGRNQIARILKQLGAPADATPTAVTKR